MRLFVFRASSFFRITTSVLAVLLVFPMAAPVFAQAEDAIYGKWEEVSALRTQGQFDQAIAVLQEVIVDYADSEEILRKAYNDLVFTYYLNRDDAGAREQARNALDHYPDLTADAVAFPPRVNETYDQLRREMFGSVTVTKPDDAQVFLDGELLGETPVHLGLIPVGTHDLRLIKDGHKEYDETIAVDPAGRHVYEISMERDRGTGWWLTRGAIVVGAGALIAAVVNSGSSEDSTPVALSTPPPPPAR